MLDRYGRPVSKIALDAGLTCPNRDGTLSRGGCLFCDAKGSGTDAARLGLSIREQIQRGLLRSGGRVAQGLAKGFIAYFQAYTNTYGPLGRLKEIWDQALAWPEIVGLSVGTRPDCVSDAVLDILAGYEPSREVWLELGLQSASDQTLARINRGHRVADFDDAVRRAHARGLKVVAHIIVGLPGEGEAEVLTTARHVANLGVFGVKIHSLYVSRDSGLAAWYRRGDYRCLDRDEFVRLAVMVLENLPPETVIHRLTGDPDPAALIGPEWSLDKSKTVRMIVERLDRLDTWQGRKRGATRPDET